MTDQAMTDQAYLEGHKLQPQVDRVTYKEPGYECIRCNKWWPQQQIDALTGHTGEVCQVHQLKLARLEKGAKHWFQPEAREVQPESSATLVLAAACATSFLAGCLVTSLLVIFFK